MVNVDLYSASSQKSLMRWTTELYRTTCNTCNFGIFLSNFFVIATFFAPLKIRIAYFNSRTPKTLLFTGKSSRFLAQNWKQCNFGWLLLKFVCHGNALCSLKNPDSKFEFHNPENPIIYITKNTFCGTWYLPHSICPQWTNCSYNYNRMHGECTKRLYFHFRSKIWLHHRVPGPDFLNVSKITVIRVHLRQI